ncbi:MAG: hypothetical protein RL106_935, partial [Bacteroidota bacterium]
PRHDEIQAWLDENAFLQEAFAGMDMDPDFSGFKSKSIQTPSHKSHFKGWIWGLAIGLGCALIAVSLWNPFVPTNNTPIITSQIKNPTTQQSSAQILSDKEEHAEQLQSTASKASKNPEQVAVSTEIESPLRPIASRVGQIAAPNQNGYPLQKINVCINIQGYEVYPYKERGAQKKMELPGTPADNGNAEEPQKEISYLAYLEETIIGYQEKDWTLVDEHCNTILKQYPDDINALYLKAKNTFDKDPNKALPWFEKTLSLNNGRLNEKEIKEYIRLSQ